ncbi:MAG: regulatory protein RecX [Candidatus Omnitrophota bacterium]
MFIDKNLEKAKNAAFRLLKFRERSEKELRDRLKKKKFDDLTIKETIAYLKKIDLLNDNNFAIKWAESRIKKPYGAKRIIYELKQKGIEAKIIDKTLADIKSRYNEYDLARQILESQIKTIKKDQDLFKTKARLYNFLIRRGFSYDVAADTIENL